MTDEAAPNGEPAPYSDAAADSHTAAIIDLEHQISQIFALARQRVRDRANQVHPGLSPGGYGLLTTLVRQGPLHAVALAACLDTDKSSISRSVRQLVEWGLVERRPDPEDGRAFYLAATPLARERIDGVREAFRARLRAILSDWDVADIRQLGSLLARLTDEGGGGGGNHHDDGPGLP